MLENADPETVGMSTDRLAAIDAAMQSFVDQRKIAGIATLAVHHGKVVQCGCYGMMDLGAGRPVQPDSIFRIYSLTKPVTAAAAMILLEEGHFKLDDPVKKWLPELTGLQVLQDPTRADSETIHQTSEITLFHLLTHTAGLGLGFGNGLLDERYRQDGILTPMYTLGYPLPELVLHISRLPLVAQPGEIWHYSISYDVLGYLIERISGQPFDVFLRERIFEPLAMADTAFWVPSEKLHRFGPLYSYSDQDGITIVDDCASSPFVRPGPVFSGGGGLVSTLPDYLRFMQMLANGGTLDGAGILAQHSVAIMTTNQLTGPTFPIRFDAPVPDRGYGFGVSVDVTGRQQVGWIGVSGTVAWLFPKDDLILIAMPQSFLNWEYSKTFVNMALASLEG